MDSVFREKKDRRGGDVNLPQAKVNHFVASKQQAFVPHDFV